MMLPFALEAAFTNTQIMMDEDNISQSIFANVFEYFNMTEWFYVITMIKHKFLMHLYVLNPQEVLNRLCFSVPQ